MLRNLRIEYLLLVCIIASQCESQNSQKQTNILSNDFDKSMPFYYKMPQDLTPRDTSPVFEQEGQKILLTGIVSQADGKTPAANVIIYYYQTDNHGIYATNEYDKRNMPKNALGQTHGHIRGWLKTDSEGRYSIYTRLPGSYPSRDEASHIHITVKEENMDIPYYIDNFVFDNDSLLTTQRRINLENRGGSGVIRFVKHEGIWIGERNIILGLNIPDYPLQKVTAVSSGKNVGEDIISFTPFHAYGDDKGAKICPICKYGWYHGILYFVGNNPDWDDIKKWLIFLDKESQNRTQYLKVYFIYGNELGYNKDDRIQVLEQLGDELQLKEVALTFVPTFHDTASKVHLNKIDPNVKNTFLIYRRSNIIDKYVNLEFTKENFDTITKVLDKTANAYFKLSRAEKE